jgi:ABC-type multidrug transport system fused ATPase/permease subunit
MKTLRARWQITTIARATRVLSRSDLQKTGMVLILQVFLGLLDLIGVALIGVLGALSVSGVKSSQPESRIYQVIEILQLENYQFQYQVAILGGLASFILIARTMLSMYFIQRTLHFLSRRSAKISAKLVSKMLSQSILQIQQRTASESVFAVTYGVTAITNGVIGTAVALISDGSMLIVMTLGLFLLDPVLASSTMLIFGLIGFVLYKLMHQKARRLGAETSRYGIASNETILEVLNSYRESVVRDRRSYYSNKIGEIRFSLARTEAEAGFMPYVSKYVIETTMVLGALLISAIQFSLQDAVQAVATLAVFLAAGTRIAPAILRIQQGALQIKGALGSAGPTLALIDELDDIEISETKIQPLDLEHSGFSPQVVLKELTFSYPEQKKPAIKGLNLQISAGEVIAIVGASGAGKTTLVDLLLGVLPIEQGYAYISGKNPLDAISEWPGAISYVPQDVSIVNGTFRDNVSLGYPVDENTDALVWSSLRIAQLEQLVNESPNRLDTQVGDQGTKLSGGQRQRLGIARAMFSQPALLVLDEATSALDGQTEADLSNAINGLKGRVTVILIAHRLSTVREADRVVYLDKGELIAEGSFDEVRNKVPNFDAQAKLMGL